MSAERVQKPQIFWRVVYQKLGGKLYIHHLSLKESDTGIEVFTNLNQEYRRLKSFPPFHFWDSGLGLYNPVIETATLSVVSLLCAACADDTD